MLCSFQNLFVLLTLFTATFQVIKDILTRTFAIPPCDDGSNSDVSDCCTSDVCPQFIKNDFYTRTTGTLKYLNQVYATSSLVLPGTLGNFNVEMRPQSYQLYDGYQEQAQKFINVIDAFDVDPDPLLNNTKPVFFPTDTTYTKDTPPKQAPYRVDVKVFYTPSSWGRTGVSKTIIFKDCNIILPPNANLSSFDGGVELISSGVARIAGGYGFEADGTTPLVPFAPDGVTPSTGQATLENFLFEPITYSTSPILSPFDGYTFLNVEYTFKINHEVLAGKDIITIGCIPSLAADKDFVNATIASDMNVKLTQLNGLTFPDTAGAQECLDTAVSNLRSNFNDVAIAQFQATTTICLNNLKSQAEALFSSLIGIGFDVYKSDFFLEPEVQFTQKVISVKIELKDKNGLSLSTNLSSTVASDLAARLKATPTFGNVSNFSYDGSQFFTADLTSTLAGDGTITAQLDNNQFSTLTIPEDLTQDPVSSVKTLSYEFINSITSDAMVRRDESDI